MRKSCVVLIVSATVLFAPWAWAQRPQGRGGFGGGGGFFLLGQESVQQELKLSADQVKRVDEHLAKQRESSSGLGELSREERQKRFAEAGKANQAALASILNEDQLKRFKQISLQQRGAQAFADPEVSAALALSDEQKSKISDIQAAAQEEMRSLFQGAAGGDREEARKKFEEARDATNEKLMGVITPEQQTTWKELTGKPFKGEIRRGLRGGNRGGAGGGGGDNRRRRNRDNADSTSALPAATQSLLTSFRGDDADDDDADDDDADDDDADDDDDKKSDAKQKKNVKKPSGNARRRGRDGRGERPDFSRGTRGQRDRAWSSVARTMGQRARHPGHPSMGHRGPERAFAHGPQRGHGPGMAFGRHEGRPLFAGPAFHREGSFAGDPGFRGAGQRFWFSGHPEPRFAQRDHGHRHEHAHARHRMAGGMRPHGPAMAPHRPFFVHHGPMMAHGRGHHGHSMAHGPAHHVPGFHAMAARPHHHGPNFASHRGHRPMHMAGFQRHRPHGPSQFGNDGHQRRGDTPSRHRRDDDDRDVDRDRDRDNDRDDD